MKYGWVISGRCDFITDVPAGAEIITINGLEVIDKCESCGKLIALGDDSFSDDEGATLCHKCYGEANHAEN